MKTLAKELLRWIAIFAGGGYGVRQLIYAVRHILQSNGDWPGLMFVLIVDLAVASPLLAVAYFCLRRQYRKLFVVVGIVGSLAVFAELSILPEQLGMFEFMERCVRQSHDWAILGMPLALLMLFGPIFAAAWFYRLCLRLAYPLPFGVERPRTRATRCPRP